MTAKSVGGRKEKIMLNFNEGGLGLISGIDLISWNKSPKAVRQHINKLAQQSAVLQYFPKVHSRLFLVHRLSFANS